MIFLKKLYSYQFISVIVFIILGIGLVLSLAFMQKQHEIGVKAATNPTQLNFILLLHGIGKAGDSMRPGEQGGGNMNILNKRRKITVDINDLNGNSKISNKTGTVFFDTDSGSFKTSSNNPIDLGSTLATGDYEIIIKMDQSMPAIISTKIIADTANQIPTISLVTGDINNDKKINMADYNILIGCFSNILPAKDCDPTRKLKADITDDGNVDQFDFNLFLRELTVIQRETNTSLTKKPTPTPTPTKTPTKSPESAPPKRAAENSFKQPAASTPSGCYQIKGISTRSTTDQPDDIGGSQMHIIYALPSDGADQNYDTNGRIASSVSAFQNWLCDQTGGQALRLDTYQGKLDITFVRFTSSDTTIRTGAELPYSTNPNSNPYVREDIEIRLNNLGLNQANKIYLVYYAGSSNYACGGASWPPSVSGHSAVMYLKGTGCTDNQLSSNMGYWEFAMLHDSLHTLGAVATCALHHTLSGHVSDGNNDLMYSGAQPWYPSVLDNGRDDYYGHNKAGCFDLADSAFLSR